MDTGTLCFGCHGVATGVDERRIPGGCHMNARGEYCHALDVTKTIEVSTLIGVGSRHFNLTSEGRLVDRVKGIRY